MKLTLDLPRAGSRAATLPNWKTCGQCGEELPTHPPASKGGERHAIGTWVAVGTYVVDVLCEECATAARGFTRK